MGIYSEPIEPEEIWGKPRVTSDGSWEVTEAITGSNIASKMDEFEQQNTSQPMPPGLLPSEIRSASGIAERCFRYLMRP